VSRERSAVGRLTDGTDIHPGKRRLATLQLTGNHCDGIDMALVETATFECGCCGTCAPSTWIDYDRLGYPICPECGRSAGPLARPGRSERRRRRKIAH